jgi:Domain of unknown function (DUF222)
MDGQPSREAPSTGMATRLDAALARLEQIRMTETEIRRLQARQIREIAGFIAERESIDRDLGVSSAPGQYRSMVAEVALSTGVSVITAQGLMSDAFSLVLSHPAVLGAVESGRLRLSAARAVVAETSHLEDESLLRMADQIIAEEAVDVLPGKVRQLAERRVIEIDPDAAARRSVRERADRHVRLVAAGSDMAYLDAYLPVEQAASCWRSLHDHAAARRASGDDRTISRLICDTLVERVTGATSADQLKTDICLVMSDTTLLRLDDKPAQLVGVGPVTAPVARDLATKGRAWLRRLFTDPVDASVTAIDSRRRLVDGSLRRAVLIADQHCRGIQCASPIRDIDHVYEHSRGGNTSFHNSQGLSKACHNTREHPFMKVTLDPDSRKTTWTTPTGLTHTSLPPPALGHGSLTRLQIQLRHWQTHPPESVIEQQLNRVLTSHARHGRRNADHATGTSPRA